MDFACRQPAFPPGGTRQVTREGVDTPPVRDSPAEATNRGRRERHNAAWMIGDELIGCQAFPETIRDDLGGKTDDVARGTGPELPRPYTSKFSPLGNRERA
jgi:hypothetical protein